MRIKLGDLLVRANVITGEELTAALAEQRRTGARLGETLVQMGILTEDLLVKALSKQLGIPRADLSAPVTGAALRKMNRELCTRYEAVPMAVSEDGRTLTVAMTDPLDLDAIDKLRLATSSRIVAYLAGAGAVRAAIARLYPDDGEVETTQSVDVRALQKQLSAQMKGPAAPRPSPAPIAQQVGPAPVFAPQPAGGQHRLTGPIPTRAAPAGAASRSAAELLRSMEDVQHREITALRAMVELLIDKGVFSREEYLARVKR